MNLEEEMRKENCEVIEHCYLLAVSNYSGKLEDFNLINEMLKYYQPIYEARMKKVMKNEHN